MLNEPPILSLKAVRGSPGLDGAGLMSKLSQRLMPPARIPPPIETHLLPRTATYSGIQINAPITSAHYFQHLTPERFLEVNHIECWPD